MGIGVTVLVVTVGAVVGSSVTIVVVGAASSVVVAFDVGISGVRVEGTPQYGLDVTWRLVGARSAGGCRRGPRWIHCATSSTDE